MRDSVIPLAFLPEGFSISWAGKTGLAVVENFCTREEAEYLIGKAIERLTVSLITVNNKRIIDTYRRSQTAVVFDPNNKDPAVIRIVMRAAMLLGLPASNVESVYVTRYIAGEYYKAHHDAYEGFDGDRYYTTLIYLNDLEENEGGGTVFEKLNIGVRPKCGRAVIWTNRNPDGSTHAETIHEALPVNEGSEKWVIQLWFRSYKIIDIPTNKLATGNTSTGTALHGGEVLPGGVWALEACADSNPDHDGQSG